MKFKAVLMSVVLLLASFAPAADTNKPLQELNRKAMHWIVMYDKSEDEAAGCTANAISDHVLLTAQHCDLPNGVLYIDPVGDKEDILATQRPHEIALKVFDGNDHMLLVVPDENFKYKVHYDPKTYKEPQIGDEIYFYGNPAGVNNIKREGPVVGAIPPTAIPNGAGKGNVYVAQLPAIGGDSGSAVFNENGNIEGIVTYSIFDGEFMGFYPLSFTPEQVALAEGKYVLLPMAKDMSLRGVYGVTIDNTNISGVLTLDGDHNFEMILKFPDLHNALKMGQGEYTLSSDGLQVVGTFNGGLLRIIVDFINQDRTQFVFNLIPQGSEPYSGHGIYVNALPQAQHMHSNDGRHNGGGTVGPRGGDRPHGAPHNRPTQGPRPHDRIHEREWHDHYGRAHCFPFAWGRPGFFVYGGVEFVVVDPLPVWWVGAPVYVDWVDGYGYVLCNPVYPGVYIAISF